MRFTAAFFQRYSFRTFVLAAVTACFLFSLFSNISHPLFWNDEGTTAVAGQRVLRFGYPKVHDGKNVLYDLNHPDYSIGIDEETDAFIAGANWAMYYLAAAGVWAASAADNVYLKTAIIRFPFALFGLAGLVILAWTVSLFFRERKHRLNFLLAFSLLCLLSVPLVLHLREVRYYSLLMFFLSCAIFLFTAFHIRSTISYKRYCLLMTLTLLALFLSFAPAFFMFYADAALFLIINYAVRIYKNRRAGISILSSFRILTPPLLKSSMPYVAALLLLLPAFRFFRIFEMADALSEYFGFTFQRYGENLATVLEFFIGYDFLIAGVALKSAALFAASKIQRSENEKLLCTLSSFLTIVFVVHFLLIARIPTYIFIRYFIVLTPILACILLLDAFLVFAAIRAGSFKRKAWLTSGVCLVLAGCMSPPVAANRAFLTGHWHEATLENKGCLDYAVDYILSNYGDPGSLVISTNYEEPVLMYYLGAKVTVGYVRNNLREDTLLQPDIIIYRKGWAWRNDYELFRGQLDKAAYDSVSFPIVDYPVNTIAQIVTPSQGLGHLFRTAVTADPLEQLKIYYRKKRF
jgi:hypothetical protein